MSGPLKLRKKGETSLQSASEANKLIIEINRLACLKIEPPTIGSLKRTEEKYILDLTRMEQLISDKVQEAINSLSVSAVCNGDGSITVTLSQDG